VDRRIGSGAYQAPDWSADFLHRQALALLDEYARQRFGKAHAELAVPDQAAIQQQVQAEMRRNTYDPQTGTVRYSNARVRAIRHASEHYTGLFGTIGPTSRWSAIVHRAKTSSGVW
jgi:nitric oxide reductase subunit B